MDEKIDELLAAFEYAVQCEAATSEGYLTECTYEESKARVEVAKRAIIDYVASIQLVRPGT